MKIYELKQDYDHYKFLVFKEDGVSSKRTLNFKGQSLKSNWTPLNFEIFTEPKKKERNKREDFNASCYFSGRLVINNELTKPFLELLDAEVEILPVIVSDISDVYFFINVLTIIDAIKKEGLELKVLMDKIRNNNIEFSRDLIDNHIIFRDSKLLHTYYCTDAFIEFAKANNVRGLSFVQVGLAT